MGGSYVVDITCAPRLCTDTPQESLFFDFSSHHRLIQATCLSTGNYRLAFTPTSTDTTLAITHKGSPLPAVSITTEGPAFVL